MWGFTRVKGWQIVKHKTQQEAGTGWTIYSPQVTRQVNRTQMELIRAAHTQSGGSSWLSSSFISAALPRVFFLPLLLLYFPLFHFYWQLRVFTCTPLPCLLSSRVALCHFAVVWAVSLFLSASLCRSLRICFCLYLCFIAGSPSMINFKPSRRLNLPMYTYDNVQAQVSDCFSLGWNPQLSNSRSGL